MNFPNPLNPNDAATALGIVTNLSQKVAKNLFGKAKSAVGGALDTAKDVGLGALKGIGEYAEDSSFTGLGVGPLSAKPKISQEALTPKNTAQSVGKSLSTLSPGTELLAPYLKKKGVNPALAFGAGLITDIATPGPGELKALSKADDVAKGVGKLDNLISEARKYKTAEEFVNSPTVQYHWSNDPNLTIGKITERGTGQTALGEGFYSTKNPEEWFKKMTFNSGKPPKYLYVVETKSPRVSDIEGIHQAISEPSSVKIISKVSVEGLPTFADFMKQGEKIDTSAITRAVESSKSQLTSLWEQAQKEKGTANIGALVGAGALGVGATAYVGDKTNDFTVEGSGKVPEQPRQTVKALATNYDPYDPSQTRPNPDGKGSAGVIMTDKMVAVSRKEPNSKEPIIPYGTVLRINGKEYLVADIKNERYHSDYQVDFATPRTGKKIIPELQGDMEIEIIELGTGKPDARTKAERFQ